MCFGWREGSLLYQTTKYVVCVFWLGTSIGKMTSFTCVFQSRYKSLSKNKLVLWCDSTVVKVWLGLKTTRLGWLKLYTGTKAFVHLTLSLSSHLKATRRVRVPQLQPLIQCYALSKNNTIIHTWTSVLGSSFSIHCKCFLHFLWVQEIYLE